MLISVVKATGDPYINVKLTPIGSEIFYDNIVAYYSLAEAYWALGRKRKAKMMHEVYVIQMEAKGKGKKIPKVVLERIL